MCLNHVLKFLHSEFITLVLWCIDHLKSHLEKTFTLRSLYYWKYTKWDNFEYPLTGELDESFPRSVTSAYPTGTIIPPLRTSINRLDMSVRYAENCFGPDLIGYLARVLAIAKFPFLASYGLKHARICDSEMNESQWSNLIFKSIIFKVTSVSIN